jgi:aldehyde dehydrogenase (NAD+)
MTRSVPRGLAGLICPWNFPLAIPLWKAAPALAFGNAVLLKPSSEAIAVAQRLEQILAKVLPDGLFQVVPGGAATARAVMGASDAVSFTGSTGVGLELGAAAGALGLPYQAEMGGQNPAVVLPDADLAFAARSIAYAAMAFAGQKCTATRRVILVGGSGEFTEALVAEIAALPIGDPMAPSTVVGPVISQRSRDAVIDAVATVAASGGEVRAGGGHPGVDGWYVEPAVVTGMSPDSPVNQVETFGPLVSILTAPSVEEAIRMANAVEQGLVAAVYTTNLSSALESIDRLDAGLIRVNAPTSGVDYHVPFGGSKSSSRGPREQGKAARQLFTQSRTITVNASP